MARSNTTSKRQQGIKTPSQRARLAEQHEIGTERRAWHQHRADAAEKQARKAAEAKRKAGPQGGKARALAIVRRLFGDSPVTGAAVQQVERDARGRMVPVRNPDKDRSLRGKARIQARRAARR